MMSTNVETAEKHGLVGAPSQWVARFTPLIPAGEVLDLACGSGRHSRLLAKQGHAVLAVDRNARSLALANGHSISTQLVDLETSDLTLSWPFEKNRFTGIVVVNYLHRALWESIVTSLSNNGVLIYETFAIGNEQFGKPSRPDFLLQPGELLEVARDYGLTTVAYEDGYVSTPKDAMMQRICAIKTTGKLSPEATHLI